MSAKKPQVAGYDYDADAKCASNLEDEKRCVYLILDASHGIVRRCCNPRVKGSRACAVHKPYVKRACEVKGGQCRAIVEDKNGVLSRCRRCRLKPEIPLCAQHYKIYKSGSKVEYEEGSDNEDIPDRARPVYGRIFKQRLSSKSGQKSGLKPSDLHRSIDYTRLKEIAKAAETDEAAAFELLLNSETGSSVPIDLATKPEPKEVPKPKPKPKPPSPKVQFVEPPKTTKTKVLSSPKDQEPVVVSVPAPKASPKTSSALAALLLNQTQGPSTTTPEPKQPSTPEPVAKSQASTKAKSPPAKNPVKTVPHEVVKEPSTPVPKQTPVPVVQEPEPKPSTPIPKQTPPVVPEPEPKSSTPVTKQSPPVVQTKAAPSPSVPKDVSSPKNVSPNPPKSVPEPKSVPPNVPKAVSSPKNVPPSPAKSVSSPKSLPPNPPKAVPESKSVPPNPPKESSSPKIVPPSVPKEVPSPKAPPKQAAPLANEPKATPKAAAKKAAPEVVVPVVQASPPKVEPAKNKESIPLSKQNSVIEIIDDDEGPAKVVAAKKTVTVRVDAGTPLVHVPNNRSVLKSKEYDEDTAYWLGRYNNDRLARPNYNALATRSASPGLVPDQKAFVEGLYKYNGCWSIVEVVRNGTVAGTTNQFLYKKRFEGGAFDKSDSLMPSVLSLIVPSDNATIKRCVEYAFYLGGDAIVRGFMVPVTYHDRAYLWRASNQGSKRPRYAKFEADSSGRAFKGLFADGETMTFSTTLVDSVHVDVNGNERRSLRLKLRPLNQKDDGNLEYVFERTPAGTLDLLDLTASEGVLYAPFASYVLNNAFDRNLIASVEDAAPALFTKCNQTQTLPPLSRVRIMVSGSEGDRNVFVERRDLYQEDSVLAYDYSRGPRHVVVFHRGFVSEDCVPHERSYVLGFDAMGREYVDAPWTIGDSRLQTVASERKSCYDGKIVSLRQALAKKYGQTFADQPIASRTVSANPGFQVEPPASYPFKRKQRPYLLTPVPSAASTVLVEDLASYMVRHGLAENSVLRKFLTEPWTSSLAQKPDLIKALFALLGYQELVSEEGNKITLASTSPIYSDAKQLQRGALAVASEVGYYAFRGAADWSVAQAKLDAANAFCFSYVLASALTLYTSPASTSSSTILDAHVFDACVLHRNVMAKEGAHRAIVAIEAHQRLDVNDGVFASKAYKTSSRYGHETLYDYGEWMISRWGTAWDPNLATRMGLSRPDTIQTSIGPHHKRTGVNYLKYRPVHQIYETMTAERLPNDRLKDASGSPKTRTRFYDTYYLYALEEELDLSAFVKASYFGTMVGSWTNSRKDAAKPFKIVVPSVVDLTHNLIVPGGKFEPYYDETFETGLTRLYERLEAVAKDLKIEFEVLKGTLMDPKTHDDLFAKTMDERRVLLVLVLPPQLLIGDPGLDPETSRGFSLLTHYLTIGHPDLRWVTSMCLHNGCFRSLNEVGAIFPYRKYAYTVPVNQVVAFVQRNTSASEVSFGAFPSSLYAVSIKDTEVLKANKQEAAVKKLKDFLTQGTQPKRGLLVLENGHYMSLYFDRNRDVSGNTYTVHYYDSLGSSGPPSVLSSTIDRYNRSNLGNKIKVVTEKSAECQKDAHSCSGWAIASIVNQTLNVNLAGLTEQQAMVYYNDMLVRPLYRYV